MKALLRSRLARHALAIGLALWAMDAVVTYRVPGWSLAAYLPWLGTAVVTLNVLLYVGGALRERGSPLDQFLLRADMVSRVVILVFGWIALLVVFNARLDRSSIVVHRAQVEEIGNRTVNAGVPIVYSWMRLRAPTLATDGELVLPLGPQELRTFWRGEPVLVLVRRGRFGLPWVMRLERNMEPFYRAVLDVDPTTRQPRKDLVGFFMERGQWEDAVAEGRRYLQDHPEDADFATYLGAGLSVRGWLDQSAEMLERAVAVRPTRYSYDRLAWVMTRRNEPRRAIEVLDAAARLYRDAWEFPFLLGYNRAKVGDTAGAIDALERARLIAPDLPDVAEVLEGLRRSADQTARHDVDSEVRDVPPVAETASDASR